MIAVVWLSFGLNYIMTIGDSQDISHLCFQLVHHGYDRDDHLSACGE